MTFWRRTVGWGAVVVGSILLLGAASSADAAAKRPVKEFHIRVAEHEHQLCPNGPKIQTWAFNAQIPGPVIRVTEGDRVKVHFTNEHTSNHTLHFHGLNVPNEMDGVAYGHLHHLEVEPGQTRTYDHSFVVTHRDGRRLEIAQEQDTVLIGPGERYDLVFTAATAGLWLFHCHVVPHVTNDGEYPGGLLIPVVTQARAAAGAKGVAR